MSEPLVEITISELPPPVFPALPEGCGAVVEFRGVVRGMEDGAPIVALEYEAYEPMARAEFARLVGDLLADFPCAAVRVHHRVGIIPAGETAILLQVAASHRREAFALASGLMDRLKQDVPIWKIRALAL